MDSTHFVRACLAMSTAVLTFAASSKAPANDNDANLITSDDATGQVQTVTTNRSIDLDSPFFQDLGTNGRRCVSCHQPDNAWTITPENVMARFVDSRGTDPIFANNDGSNCEGVAADSYDEKRSAYSLLLTRGLIRIGLDVPAGAEFAIEQVDDPFHCGPATNDASLYRRPLPTTNLRFLSAVMWDGRESTPTTTILQDLAGQANGATRGHAQAVRDLTRDEARQIVAFETGLFTAQARDTEAGSLHARGATGGPVDLAQQPFFIGINDPVGLNPTGAAFDPNVFNLFNAWASLATSHGDKDNARTRARLAVARGQAVFNNRAFTISDVAGLNGETFPNGVTVPESFSGTCTICHDTPNAGNHSRHERPAHRVRRRSTGNRRHDEPRQGDGLEPGVQCRGPGAPGVPSGDAVVDAAGSERRARGMDRRVSRAAGAAPAARSRGLPRAARLVPHGRSVARCASTGAGHCGRSRDDPSC